MPPTAMQRPDHSRNQSLDVLRGFAILLVICDHLQWLRVMRIGWIGVDLFFVLSGFLISGLLFADIQQLGKIRVGRFLLRRGFKIYPPLIVFLGFTALLSSHLRSQLWIQALFLQNYLLPPETIWVHTWSLAVEEHFYLVLPFVLGLLVWRKRLNLLPWISAALALVCFVLRLRCLNVVELLATHRRIDTLFFGVTLGWLYSFERERFLKLSTPYSGLGALVAIAGAVLAFFSGPVTMLRANLTITFSMIGFGLLVLWAVPRTIPLRHVAEIGRYSYSIYLWNVPVALGFGWESRFGTAQVPLASFATFVGCLLLSLAVGVTMGVLVEMPALRLRDWLVPRLTARSYTRTARRISAAMSAIF